MSKQILSNKITAAIAAAKKSVPKADALESALFSRPTDGLNRTEAARVDKKLAEFSRTVAKAEELDAEIVRLQQASRTSFKSFRKIHAYLCVHNKLYNKLHSTTYVSQVNFGALAIFILSLSVGIGTLYNPYLKVNNKPVFVAYIKASAETDNTLFKGDNDDLSVGFSDKTTKTAGITIESGSSKITHPERYQLGLHLLADGLNVPADKQLGDKPVSWHLSRNHTRQNIVSRFIAAATAQTGSADRLPANTVSNVQVEQTNPQQVNYKITDDLVLRYEMSDFVVKEFITVRDPKALTGNQIHFSLQQSGLVFRAADDGSWQAFRQEDKDKMDTVAAVFRLHKPTIDDKNHVAGKIDLTIENGQAIYTIDQDFLKNAAYPIFIDPTISPSGTTCTWNNGAGTNVWATAGNWSCGHAPTTGDAVVFNTTSNTDANVASETLNDNIYSLSLNAGYTHTVTLAAKPLVNTAADQYAWNLQTVTINSGNLVLTGDTTVNPAVLPAGCSVSVICGRGIQINANTLTVASGASINANGKGFSDTSSPGFTSNTYTGGTYGGRGGKNTASKYGSATSPTSLGSAGANSSSVPDGVGGGAVSLNISGTLTIDGTVSANGTTTQGMGAGSGGSILVSAGTLAGTGSVAADGATASLNNAAAGGGGGRIAMSATTTTFSGSVSANGGDPSDGNRGYAGTIILPASMMGASGSLTLGGNGNIASLTLGNDTSYTFSALTINSGGSLKLDGDPLGNQSCTGVTAGTYCGSGGTLTTGSLTIASGGSLNADGLGFDAGQGPGTILGNAIYSGGTYGGYGANATNKPYGSTTSPNALGSGGLDNAGSSSVNAGKGGGAITLNVTGTLANNGTISANGGTAQYGGGSAGSLLITAGTLSGNGTISANGSDANANGAANGGGGGRVALTATSSSYSGTVSAYGGASGTSTVGGAGTVYKSLAGTKTLTIDNNGNASNLGSGIVDTDLTGYGTLTITNGGILTHAANTTAETYKLTLSVDDLTVTSTGAISANNKGYSANNGPGNNGSGLTGASHGGLGGSGGGTTASATYGSSTAPVTIGSGGGAGSCSSTAHGGGAIKLTVTNTLTNNGTVSANGGDGCANSGGSSGGSVYFIAATVNGSGTVTANGANAVGQGNGGGGGRIAITASTFGFSGSIAANGGSQVITSTVYGRGSAGTIVLPSSIMGASGNLTLGGSGNMTSLTLGNDIAYTFNTITINSGGSLAFDGNLSAGTGCSGVSSTTACGTGGTLTAATVTVASGGSLHADGLGFGAAAGPGAGGSTYGGAGHGAAGGAGTSGAGGTSYGSSAQPLSLGSGGGIGSCGGANAGGAIKMTISGTLTNNGRISANAATSCANSGGSSGGSVYLTVATMTGNGTFEAKGANGVGGGGGGAGGRVGIYVTGTDTFSGTRSVSAGTGNVAGNTGTNTSQHYPTVTVNSPANSATNVSQNPSVTFTITDSESDYVRARIELSTDNFTTQCNLTQTSLSSVFTANACGGNYNRVAGAFTGMNYDSDGDGTSDSFTSGSTGTFTFSSDLTQGQAYQVRVKAADPGGAAGLLGASTNNLTFDGSNDWIDLGASSDLNFTNSFTIEGWVKPLASEDTQAGIICKAIAGGSTEYCISMFFGVYQVAVNDGAAIARGTTQANTNWTHLAATYNGSQLKLYVNGALDATVSYSSTITATSNHLAIGTRPVSDFFNNPFGGEIDEVRLSDNVRYTGAFTPTRVEFNSDSHTRGLWHFNEGTGTTTADSSSHGNSGTLKNNFTNSTPANGTTNGPIWKSNSSAVTDDSVGLWANLTSYASRSFTISAISKVVFSTSGNDTTCTDLASAQTIVAYQVSSAYYPQVCNGLDEAVKVANDQIIALSATNTATGTFSATSNGTFSSTLNVTISSGASYTTFYFKDTAIGTPTITASPTGKSWTVATQQPTIKSDTPDHLGLSANTGNPRAGDTVTVTITAYDQYNNTATDFTGSKTIKFNGAASAPDGTNPSVNTTVFGNLTSITFTNGVSSSASMVLTKVESPTVTATDFVGGTTQGITTSTGLGFTVRPGVIANFVPSDYPKSTTSCTGIQETAQAQGCQYVIAGSTWDGSPPDTGSTGPYQVQVTAYDTYDNVKTDYTGSFWFSLDSAYNGQYSFTYNSSSPFTFSSGDNGFASFTGTDFRVDASGLLNFNLETTGIKKSYKIKVKPDTIGSVGVSYSPTLGVNDVLGASLPLKAGNGTTGAVDNNGDGLGDASTARDIIVTAYDRHGNVKTDYAGAITFTSTDTTATLPNKTGNPYAFTDVDLGSHTFAGNQFAFNAGGNHTITITDVISDPTSPFTSSTPQVSVRTNPLTNFAATAGHQQVTLSWDNPTDAGLKKVNIYVSTTPGSLGYVIPDQQPNVTPGTASLYTVRSLPSQLIPGGTQSATLVNGTTYYFTMKGVSIDVNGNDLESAATSQVSAVPADIAPRNITASQGSDGRVTISYGLRFASTVTISYYDPSARIYKSASAAALTGDVGSNISGSSSIDSHTVYWTPATDFPNKYYLSTDGFRIRVDVLAQSSSAQGVSNNIFLDTNPPRVNSGENLFVVDATGGSTADLTLLAREDGATEQAIQYRLSNNADMSGGTDWTTLSTKPTVVRGWTLGDSTTVYVQYRDPYNNITRANSAILDIPTNFALKDGSNIDAGDYRLLLIWTVPQVTNFSRFLIDRSTDGSSYSQIDTTTKNGYVDVNLASGGKYYYRVKAQDTVGNISRPSTVLFSQPGAAPDVTAKPVIDIQNWKQEFGVRATIKWSTDQLADSFVVYSKKPLQPGTSTLTTDGTAAQVVGQFDKSNDHQVLVQQLDPSTKYYFKTLSQNEIKITGASEVVEVTTPARIPLTLSGVAFSNTKPTSTTVGWQTNKLSTTQLEYGTTASYGTVIQDKNLNTDHTATISNLTDGTTYHVRIQATDADGNTTVSDDYVVSTPATPTISGVKVTDVKETSATVSWTTNVNTDSNVQFGTGNDYGSQQGKSDLTTLHSVIIIGLTPATTYHYKVRSADAFGSVAMSGDNTFATPKDTTAPKISAVKSEISTTGSGDAVKIQAIISWDTDEAATSQVEYGLGVSGDYANKTTETVSFNQSHTVILPDLKPNASYQYRIVSKDAAGNIVKGEDLTIVTPPKDKSLLQLVLKSLEDTFSWTRKLKGFGKKK